MQNASLPLYMQYQAVYSMIRNPKAISILLKTAVTSSTPIQNDIIYLVSVLSKNNVKLGLTLDQCCNGLAKMELMNYNLIQDRIQPFPSMSDRLDRFIKTRSKKAVSTSTHANKQVLTKNITKQKLPCSGVPKPG